MSTQDKDVERFMESHNARKAIVTDHYVLYDNDTTIMLTEPQLRLVINLVQKEREAVLDDFIEHAKNHGFEKLDLIVEYQDGTNSGVLPFRKHWNRCYGTFMIAVETFKKRPDIEVLRNKTSEDK